MANTPHAKLRKEITDWLASIGAWYVCTNSQGYGRKGIPDIVGIWDTKGFVIEVKVRPDKPSPWQKRELAAASGGNARGVAVVAYMLDDVKLAMGFDVSF